MHAAGLLLPFASARAVAAALTLLGALLQRGCVGGEGHDGLCL
jgi:hypothetical protein